MAITCGVDWAEDHHDVVVMDDLGRVLQGRRIDAGVDGYADLLALIAEHGGSAAETPVALETDKNLLVLALRAGGFSVYPINPRAVARYRERHYQAGKKSDHGDASVLADILRTDRHQHRPLPAISDHALTIKAPALRQPPSVEEAMGLAAKTLIDILTQMHAAVASLNDALTEQFSQHALAPVLTSAPGLGTVLAARILAEVGDDPGRFETPASLRAFAGTAPVTRASGGSSYVKARKVRNKRLGDACHWWAFSTLTKSPGARAHYDHRRAIGDTHNAALRNLANKLLGRLWWCIQNQLPWDESAAWPTASPSPQAAAA